MAKPSKAKQTVPTGRRKAAAPVSVHRCQTTPGDHLEAETTQRQTRRPIAEKPRKYILLPVETWTEICGHVERQQDLGRLARVNKTLMMITSNTLYKNVTIRSVQGLRSFSDAIAEHAAKAASVRTLRLEWVEDKRVLTPKDAPRWFMEMLAALRNGKVEHLALLVSPPEDSPAKISTFDRAVQKHAKALRLSGFTLPQSVRTLDAKVHLLHDKRVVPVSPGQPVAPLVALSLHALGLMGLSEWDFPMIIPMAIPMASTLRRLRISLKSRTGHPLWFGYFGASLDPLRLPNVEYFEIVHHGPCSEVRVSQRYLSAALSERDAFTESTAWLAASRQTAQHPPRELPLTEASCSCLDSRLWRRASPQTRGSTSRLR